MTPEYKQVNRLWCYDFNNKELFAIPASVVPAKPAFLFDTYNEVKLSELSATHSVNSISFWSCEDEETLTGYLSGLLPQYHMIMIYNKYRKCVIVAEGTENIYKDAKKSWRTWETPGDVMVRLCSNNRIVRTQKEKVLVFDPLICSAI